MIDQNEMEKLQTELDRLRQYRDVVEELREYVESRWPPRRAAYAWRFKDIEYIRYRLAELEEDNDDST